MRNWSVFAHANGTVLATAAGFALCAIIRIYGIEWPILLAQRRWNERLPMWLEIGWLSELLTLLAEDVARVARVRQMLPAGT